MFILKHKDMNSKQAWISMASLNMRNCLLLYLNHSDFMNTIIFDLPRHVKYHSDNCALLRFRSDYNVAFVQINNRFNDGKSQSIPCITRDISPAMETFE